MEISTTSKKQLGAFIDHTLLKPETTLEQVNILCHEAIDNKFVAVCVPPFFVEEAAKLLQGTGIKIATVIGFPLGYSPTSAKVEEAKQVIAKGADELDMMINITAVKGEKWSFVQNDIQSVTTICHMQNKIVKVIIETGLLTDDEIKKVCEICTEVQVDFVKTSSGFTSTGATIESVMLLRHLLPEHIKVKATGGIRTRQFAEDLIAAGADRLGTSSGVTIVA